ncbi:MAG: quinone-interacting membrane-bound oxidoreductase complex subunit QmoC [Planctomycetota bacterium]
MVAALEIRPSDGTRAALRAAGATYAARCYQCGTCSSVCELVTRDFTFPRRQMMLAQWGLGGSLARDPAVWLCHACSDCSTRCPRDAKPADVMQAARAVAVEGFAVPRLMGRIVSRAGATWPLLLGVPIASWALLVGLATGFAVAPHEVFAYERLVPHSLIYAVFFPVAAYVSLVGWISGRRFWSSLAGGERRRGAFLSALVPTLVDIILHRRFATCTTARSRRQGHLWLVLGFLGAAVTSGLLILAIYLMRAEMPLGLGHPFKLLGNLSAVFLAVGGWVLLRDRLAKRRHVGTTTAFDSFFLGVVVLVIATGIVVEAARFALDPRVAGWLYIVHLGAVMCLFLTTPYSKFAHILYRTLAMAHERMVASGRSVASRSETLDGSLAHPTH